ncbi:MAG: T9SS type B sorting domain-containing protein [Crocinitomix sp.]|nr:T9SS type B sorting domain-containing protein [Crocinitomix sp.]
MPNFQRLFYVLIALFFSFSSYGQVIVNGSFEVTTAPVACNYNLSNAVFNGWMTDVQAYGGGNETDIIMDGCYVTDLPDGLRSISIAHVPEDEVSMLIDAPLTTGVTYTLSFWALSETTFTGSGDVVIGASTSATAFGTLIQTVSPTVMAWGNHTFTFVAPNDATHITVRNAPGGAYWNHLDHFEFIVPVDELDTEVTDATCFGACDGTATVLEGVVPPYTFLWDAGAGAVTTAEATDLCAGTYSVEVTNGSGDLVVLDVTIEEPEEIIAGITSQTDVTCFGSADGSVLVEALGGTGALTYDIGGGPLASGDFVDLPGGLYTVTVTDENGCTVDVAVDILEPTELLLTEVATIDVLCNGGDNGEIEVIGSGGTGTYTYSIDGGLFGAGTTFTTLTAGDYTIAVQDENTCETSIIITINEPEPLIVIENVTGEICEGDCIGTIDLEASGGTGPYTYSIDACATSDGVGAYVALCAGAYDICVEDANGCQYTSVLIVAAGTAPVDATIVPFGPLCIDAAAVSIDAVDTGVLTGPGVLGGMFDPGVAGVGTHTITNTIADGCGGLATFDVVVNPLPVVSFTANENSGCAPVKVIFTNTGDVGTSCEWNFGDGAMSASCGVVTHEYSNPGTYDVTLSITDLNGCSNSVTYYDYIDVFEVPVANFVFDPVATTTLDTEVDFTDYSVNASAWIWTFDSFGNSTDQNPNFIFPDQEGSYDVTLIAVSDNGCRDTITKTLNIHQEQLIFVPNAITPDGDTYNEIFKPYFTGIDIYDYHLTIYNRWGEILFESYNLATGWNGTFGGEIVEDGVYIWHITTADIATDDKLEFFGHVTVIK